MKSQREGTYIPETSPERRLKTIQLIIKGPNKAINDLLTEGSGKTSRRPRVKLFKMLRKNFLIKNVTEKILKAQVSLKLSQLLIMKELQQQ